MLKKKILVSGRIQIAKSRKILHTFLFNKITEIFNTAPSEEVLLANHYIKSYLVLEG